MGLPILMVLTVALATTVLSASIPSQSAELPTESNVETFDSSAVQKLPQQLPLSIQLPRENSWISFNAPEPDSYLKAPQYNPNPQPNFYEVPVPLEYLSAPTEGVWNPDDDPTLYYELPASLTKENFPTNQYPKKFNKDIHNKDKPVSNTPKHLIELEPINEAQYVQKQKQLYKTIEKLNKKENQKDIEIEKVPKRILKPRVKPQEVPKKLKDNTSHQTKLTKSPKVLSKTLPPATKIRHTKNDEIKVPTDSSNSETTFGQNYDTHPEKHDSDKFSKGLSPHITDSLGLTSNNGAGGKQERILFHMAGHDGPMSYKWGYDTGKGHNRQFRFEERDKEGIVKGHFGYYDSEGKFRKMNYEAHPIHGYHMEADPESEIKK